MSITSYAIAVEEDIAAEKRRKRSRFVMDEADEASDVESESE